MGAGRARMRAGTALPGHSQRDTRRFVVVAAYTRQGRAYGGHYTVADRAVADWLAQHLAAFYGLGVMVSLPLGWTAG